MKNFLFRVSSESTSVCCHVGLGSGTIEELLELRQKFLDTQKTTPGLSYFEVTNRDAEFFEGAGASKLTERLNGEEMATLLLGKPWLGKPWLELSLERANDLVRDIDSARTKCDYAHIDERGIFWSCQEKYTDETWETDMIPWEEFGVKSDRAALALAIVEQLAEEFSTDEDINGGDLVDWIGGRLAHDGFLKESDESDHAMVRPDGEELVEAPAAPTPKPSARKYLCVWPGTLHALRMLADKLESSGEFGDDAESLRAIATRVERFEEEGTIPQDTTGTWEVCFPQPDGTFTASDPMSFAMALQLVKEKFGADNAGKVCMLNRVSGAPNDIDVLEGISAATARGRKL